MLSGGASVVILLVVGGMFAILALRHSGLHTFLSGTAKSIGPSPLSARARSADAHALPLGVEYPGDSLPNRIPLIWWLLAVELLGLISFPLAYVALPGLRDRGWGLAKILGLLLLSYLVWLPASLGWLPFERWAVYAALGVVVMASAALAWWRRGELVAFLRARWRLLALTEGVFVAAFLLLAWIRAQDPSLFYFNFSGEKPFELSMLNGLLRSRTLPPLDPWFAGQAINYYYYGLYLVAVLIKLTGVAPTTAFNLALALFFGICATAAFSVVGSLIRRWWAGLIGAFAFLGVCNLDAANQEFHRLIAALTGQPVPAFDYFASSRVQGVIEFPYWSFIFGDLHPHVMDLVLTTLLLACCASLLLASRARSRPALSTLALVALTLGAIWCTNTWDYPSFALLFAVTLVLPLLPSVSRGEDVRNTPLQVGEDVRGKVSQAGKDDTPVTWGATLRALSWRQVIGYALRVGIPLALSYVLYLPFHHQFQAVSEGIGRVRQGTPVSVFLIVFGVFLFVAVSYFGVELYERWRVPGTRLLARAGLPAGALPWLLALGGALVLALAARVSLATALAVLLAAGLYLALDPRHSAVKRFTYVLLLLGLAIALGVELIYVKDFLALTIHRRMNTVFKFYYQVWLLFAFGTALAFCELVGRVGARAWRIIARDVARAMRAPVSPPRLAQGAWIAVLALLLAASSVFLVAGTADRLADPTRWAVTGAADHLVNSTHWIAAVPPPGGLKPVGLSLDGMAYMRAWYPGDYAAITWMNAHIAGSPTIVEAAEYQPYRYFGRVSAYTGLPTVIGWGHHERQWHPSAEAQARLNDVQGFWGTADPAAALAFLRHYDVRYVYLGQQERSCYMLSSDHSCVPMNGPALAKLDTLEQSGVLRVVYSSMDTVIYEVSG
jgi:YYY domain-containing protein